MLRPTWHFVLAEDIGWLLDLTGPRIRRLTGQQLRETHGLDEPSIDHAVAVVLEALADRGHLTRPQLADKLRERGVTASGQVLMLLLAHAELGGLICSGRPTAGAPAAIPTLTPQEIEALDQAASRYGDYLSLEPRITLV